MQNTFNAVTVTLFVPSQAVVFMGIVGVFLACHILRVLLNLHEMIVIVDAMECREAGKGGFPMWALVMTSFR